MKTVTEFASATLKNAARVQQELMTAGKTAEELPQALGEALKLEGDKLTSLLAALEAVGTKFDDLKRVVVMSLAEGEKAPHRALQKGELYFVAEYYPPLVSKERPAKSEGRFEGKGRGRKGDRKKGQDGRRGRPRPDQRSDQAGGNPTENRESAPAQRRRPPRGQPRGPIVPSGKPPVIVPKSAQAPATSTSAPVASESTPAETPTVGS